MTSADDTTMDIVTIYDTTEDFFDLPKTDSDLSDLVTLGHVRPLVYLRIGTYTHVIHLF